MCHIRTSLAQFIQHDVKILILIILAFTAKLFKNILTIIIKFHFNYNLKICIIKNI